MMKGMSALAAALLGLIPRGLIDVVRIPAGTYSLPNIERHSRGKGKGGVPSLLVLHRSIRRASRPERPRHWHNPADPIQATRIEAAREKRNRRMVTAHNNAQKTYMFNDAWRYEDECDRLDPFHVVRS